MSEIVKNNKIDFSRITKEDIIKAFQEYDK